VIKIAISLLLLEKQAQKTTHNPDI